VESLTLREVLGLIGIAFGLFFYIVGVIGFVRFPDVYMRIHSAGKVSALGIFGFIIGGAILMPDVTLRVIALGIFMFVTQPVASHAVADAAYRSGMPMVDSIRDDLKGKIEVHSLETDSAFEREQAADQGVSSTE
jgi:multicomponent Na+:H+ antiporter subunit G